MYKTLLYAPFYVRATTLRRKLAKAIDGEIERGCKHFVIGGEIGVFNKLCLQYCRYVRDHYYPLEITLVVPDAKTAMDFDGNGIYLYRDVNVLIYHDDEEKQMVDDCDAFICNVDEDEEVYEDYLNMIKRARAQNKRVLNIFPTPEEENAPPDYNKPYEFGRKY